MEDLFGKGRLGGIEVRNHFVRSATFERRATEDGYPTKTIEGIYLALADGGVGTIITSYTFIAGYEQPRQHQLGIYDDALVPAYRDLVQKVHERGSKIVMQIAHGSSLSQGYPETARVLGPSAVENPESGIVPQEMSEDDIAAVTGLFTAAARRVKEAGFDGVQLHCGHGYLLSQFTSPLFNKRTDGYGGDAPNRYRFVGEVYQAVRDAVGRDFPVWIKMNSSDEQEGGLTVDDFLVGARGLASAGIDCIEVSGNRWASHARDERAYYADAAVRLSEEVDTPIILTGGLRTMDDLKAVCERSRIRYFGFARPLMSDPEFLKSLA